MSPDEFMLIDRSYADVDALTEATRGYDLDFLQLDRAHFSGRVLQLLSPRFILSRGTFGCQLRQMGAPPAGFRTFVLPMNPTMRMRWRAQEVNGANVLLFPAGGELLAATDGGFDVYTLSVLEEDLLALVYGRAREALATTLKKREVFPVGPAEIVRMRQYLLDLEYDRFGIGGGSCETLHVDLMQLLLAVIAGAQGGGGRSPSPFRTRLIREVNRMVLSRPDEPPTVEEICRVAGASPRTLTYAFQDCFGESPKAYIRSLRLNEVRRCLQAGRIDPVKVADAANAWGFWHMGQFAADYRKLFGEKPSQTLARRTA